MPRIIDISPVLRPGGPVWPGDAPTQLSWTSRIADGARANVGALSLSTHAGAHADAPLHVFADGGDVAGLSLEAYWGPARVFELSGVAAIDRAALTRLDWMGVERALFRTTQPGAHLTEDAAGFLIQRRIRLVGIDSLSVDVEGDPELPVHRALAYAETAILECLRLEEAPAGDYELVALPLAIPGADASPVRAALKIV